MEALSIKNFKNLRELNIPVTANVNLVTGRNNVGKSTLLEALAIYVSNGNMLTIIDILQKRGLENKNVETFSSLFPNYQTSIDKNNVIEIGDVNIQFVKYSDLTTTHDNKVEISRVIARTEVEMNNSLEWIDGIEVRYGDDNSQIHPLPSLFIKSHQSKHTLQYIRTNDLKRDINGNLWDNVVMTDKEKDIISALQIVEPTIEAISFIIDPNNNTKRIPVVKLKNDNQRHYLSSMGDGINRIFTIILAMVNCQSGVCLIDEFENGLHYTTQTQLWKIIFKLANDYSIQFFATTHSNDCIRSFAEAMEGCEKNQGMMLRLEEKKNHIFTVTYSKEELLYGADNQIEMR